MPLLSLGGGGARRFGPNLNTPLAAKRVRRLSAIEKLLLCISVASVPVRSLVTHAAC